MNQTGSESFLAPVVPPVGNLNRYNKFVASVTGK